MRSPGYFQLRTYRGIALTDARRQKRKSPLTRSSRPNACLFRHEYKSYPSRSGNLSAMNRTSALLTATGCSWAIQCPDLM